MPYPQQQQPPLDTIAAAARRSAWRLGFPDNLEAIYRHDHRLRAVAFFRLGSLLIALLYLL
ncbi:MAG: hypothetical protein K0S16_1935, partial [Moraxellaceae bacterium]|nr:hypothetical protein [Moraxellaceae bacterium]